VVRIAYIIPTNRTAQGTRSPACATPSSNIKTGIAIRWSETGLDRKHFDTKPSLTGVTPKVYTVNVTETDAYLRGDLWSRTIAAATAAGVPVWTSNKYGGSFQKLIWKWQIVRLLAACSSARASAREMIRVWRWLAAMHSQGINQVFLQ